MDIHVQHVYADRGNKSLNNVVICDLPEDWVSTDVFEFLNKHYGEELTQFSYEEMDTEEWLKVPIHTQVLSMA